MIGLQDLANGVMLELGDAETEAEEFAKIYKLDVIVIPPNKTLRRVEEPDSIYRTAEEKSEAIVNDIVTKQEAGRPVLDEEIGGAVRLTQGGQVVSERLKGA